MLIVFAAGRFFVATCCLLLPATAIAQQTSFQECQGPCGKDRDCEWGLNCWKQRNASAGTVRVPVPGCNSSDLDPAIELLPDQRGYCFKPLSGELVLVGNKGVPETVFPLQTCQGNCLSDDDCAFGLVCFERDDKRPISGCTGGGQSGWNYCHPPPTSETLVLMGENGTPKERYPLLPCQGECIRDSDCDWGLKCVTNEGSIPFCTGSGVSNKKYCSRPVDANELVLMGKNGEPALHFPLGECQGDCNNDSHCASGLVCHRRRDNAPVAGCTGHGQPAMDYCGRPVNNRQLMLVADLDKSPEAAFPLLPCQGHCHEDDDCIGDYACTQRTATHPIIPGCTENDSPALMDRNYCTAVTYVPGLGTAAEHGLQLSQGLTARVLARTGKRVRVRGGASQQAFHALPDGAAVFDDPSGSGGWAYVSNSEHGLDGGVGALYFDRKGRVIDYQMILTESRSNCGGGKTYWGTFLSCEERDGGRVWEIDPWAQTAQPTVIDESVGAFYESAAYDNRDPNDPKFFFTMDSLTEGPLLRFSPDPQAVQDALQSDNFSNLLREPGSITFEYLVLQHNSSFVATQRSHKGSGSFVWTKNRTEATENAAMYYPLSEGLDIRNGMLYMTTKRKRRGLFVLNLTEGTFDVYSTNSGAFDEQPDQIRSILRREHFEDGQLVQEERSVLYFCEDGALDCGVHGRDSTTGQLYSILQAQDPDTLYGETTGLAFSSNLMFMYLSFQKTGVIFEVRRTDGWPFDGGVLDIKYHTDEESNFE